MTIAYSLRMHKGPTGMCHDSCHPVCQRSCHMSDNLYSYLSCSSFKLFNHVQREATRHMCLVSHTFSPSLSKPSFRPPPTTWRHQLAKLACKQPEFRQEWICVALLQEILRNKVRAGWCSLCGAVEFRYQTNQRRRSKGDATEKDANGKR